MNSTIRILHLEDDALSSQLAFHLLRRDGLLVEIDRVDQLEEFEKRLQQSRYSLILSDFSIPGMDVFDALKLARRRQPDVPYVFFSGTLGEEAAVEALRQGATDYVLKDHDRRLPSAVRRALQEGMERARRQAAEHGGQLLAAIVASSEDAIFSQDLNSVITSWNKAAERLYGYSPEEAIGQKVSLIIPADLIEEERRLSERLKSGRGIEHLETFRVKKDGSIISVSLSASPVCDQNGNIIGASKIARDITSARRTEEELRLSEARFRLFMDNSPTLAWVKDEKGRYVYLSRTYEQRFGVRLADLLGKTDAQLWPPETAARLQRNDQAVLTADRPVEFTEETIEKDGSRSYWLNNKFPFRDAAGNRLVASIGLDITPLKEAEAALRASEEKFRTLADNMSQFAWMADQNGWLFWYNRRWFEYTGTSLEEMQGWGWEKVHHPEHLDRVAKKWKDCFTTGQTWEDTFPLRGRHGEYRWFLSRAVPIRDEQGNLLRWFGTNTDITEQKLAEEALRRSEEISRAIFEQAAIGIGRVGFTDARWIDVNATFCRMLGYSREEMRATPWPDITHPEDVELDLVPFRQMAAGKLTSYSVEKRFVHRDGHHVWARLTLSLVRDHQGRPDYEIAIIEDISERKKTELALQSAQEELARANEDLERKVHERTRKLEESIGELESFSYSLVHDLRAPLRAMNTYATLLENDAGGQLRPESAEYLRRIKVAANRMDQLITDSLSYSRILRDDLPLEPINLGALLRGMVETYPNLQAPAAEIRVDIDQVLVLSNEAALTQVFSNLLGNAVKFVAPGVTPKVRIWAQTGQSGQTEGSTARCGVQPANASKVVVCVEDNGIGIPQEMLERIFGMFQRMHRDEEYPGTGIGLAIVRKSLERVEGRVCVESEKGKGSRFFVELPRYEPALGKSGQS